VGGWKVVPCAVGWTPSEEGGCGVGGLEGSDEETYGATKGGADGHGGDEDSCGDFTPVGDYNEDCADNSR
jgi:hypothetical protein